MEVGAMASKGRFGRLLRSSVQALLAPAEDPRERYADPASQQRFRLDEIRAAEARLTVTIARLSTQRDLASQQADALGRRALDALSQGSEESAQSALRHQWRLESDVAQFDRQLAALQREEQSLAAAADRLAAQIESNRSREQVAAARHSAAKAQVAAGEALSGLGAAFPPAGTVEQIEKEAERLEYRAAAIDEMLADGLLGPPAAGRRITEDRAGDQDEIERRLQRMRALLGRTPSGES
jgi:phage shock protein A